MDAEDYLNPKVSIITVVYNSENLIERTILSVIGQSFKNIEYIIIDGLSKDKTIDCIKKYQDNIDFWISEKDAGIYDAMNKGLNKATGNYVLFLNSGDELHDVDTLKNIFNNKQPLKDVYYGHTEIYNEQKESLGDRRLKPPVALTWKSLKYGMVVCHQSFIVKRELASNYNLKYKIAADIDWMISCLRKSKEIQNTYGYISKYIAGGVSRKNIIKSLMERFEIMVKNYGVFQVVVCHFIIAIKFFSYLAVNRKIN